MAAALRLSVTRLIALAALNLCSTSKNAVGSSKRYMSASWDNDMARGKASEIVHQIAEDAGYAILPEWM